MKRLLSFLVVAGGAVGVQAQITGTISPSGGSVYSPEYYGNVMEVVYNDSIVATGAEALVTVGGESTAVPIVNVEKYGFGIDLESFLSGKTDNLVFTVSVDGVVPMAVEVSSVDKVAATYLLRKELPTATPNPESGEVTKKAFELKVDFSEAVHVGQFGFVSGPRFAKQVKDKEGNPGYEKLVTVEVLDEYWKAETEESNLTVNLNEVSIENGGEVWTLPNYSFSYLFKEASAAANYLGVDPEPGTLTPWEVYADGWGVISLQFDNEVDYSKAYAIVSYETTDSREPIEEFVSSEELWGDWSFWTKNYSLDVILPYSEEVTEDNLLGISIIVKDIMIGEEKIVIPLLEYYDTQNTMRKGSRTASIDKVNGNSISDAFIYTIDGRLYKKETDRTSLPAGIYITNGKKFSVK